MSCQLNGAEDIMGYMREKLNVGHFETTYDGRFSYEEVECLAACDRAPCMQVNLEFVYDLTRDKVDEMLRAMYGGTFEAKPLPQTVKPGRDWRVGQEPPKRSPGAQGVRDPNDPGGIGDPTGLRMLERIVEDPRLTEGRPTSERLVRDGVAIVRDGRSVEHEAS
jgi:hypothetical protein